MSSALAGRYFTSGPPGKSILTYFVYIFIHIWKIESLGIFTSKLIVQSLSCVRLPATPWTIACQASLSFTITKLTKCRHPTPVLLPGKSHGRRSLVGCSPWGCEESDMTERLHFHFPLSCIGEGNGNPLQCSCLENPRDGGAWWAVISGVAQIRT